MTDVKTGVKIVIIGDRDSGRSTLRCRLLFEFQGINERDLAKLKREAQDLGKESRLFELYLDESRYGRDCRRDIGLYRYFQPREYFTKSHHYTIVDGPQKRDFIKNMIVGPSRPDVALLVVAANSLNVQSQTQQQIALCHFFGIEQLIVCVNQMDEKSVKFAEERFNEIKAEISSILTKIGYKTKRILFIPISALKGDNIKESSPNMPWFQSPCNTCTLSDALDNVIKPQINEVYKLSHQKLLFLLHGYFAPQIKRLCVPQDIIGLIINMIEIRLKPLRMPVSGVYKIKGVGDVITGQIQQGRIMAGRQVKFYPSGVVGSVIAVEMHHKTVNKARRGDNVGVLIGGLFKQKERRPRVGDVMVVDDQDMDPSPPKAVKSFTAIVRVVQNETEMKLQVGYSGTVHIGTAKAPCEMTAIQWKIGTGTGKVERPVYIQAGDEAQVTFQANAPVVALPFSELPALARFVVKHSNSVVMIGKVLTAKI